MKNTLKPVLLMSLLLAMASIASAQEAAPSAAADKPEPKTEVKAEPKDEAKVEPKAEVKAEPKAELKDEAKVEPKAEAKAEPKAELKEEAKVEPKAEVKAEPKAEVKVEPKAQAAAPVKELNSIAKAFVPLADNYKKAHDELRQWILHIDAETSAVSSEISRIQEKIERNESAITKLKLEGSRESAAKIPELSRDNKQLWADLSAARKERTALGEGFAREAVQRAKAYQLEIIQKLEAIKAQTK